MVQGSRHLVTPGECDSMDAAAIYVNKKIEDLIIRIAHLESVIEAGLAVYSSRSRYWSERQMRGDLRRGRVVNIEAITPISEGGETFRD